jgi:hypothetical protein
MGRVCVTPLTMSWMTMTANDWDAFITSAVAVLEKLQSGNSSDLASASKFFEESTLVTGEVREFLINSIWEIDAPGRAYKELLDFLRMKPTHAMVIEYINKQI